MTEITRLIQRAEAGDFSAHQALEMTDYDLSCDDGRARQGLGLTPSPLPMSESDRAALDEYLSTH